MREEQMQVIEGLHSGGNGKGNRDRAAQSSDVGFGGHSNFPIQAQPAFEPILGSEEAAALLKIHPKTLQKLARKGRIPGFRIGKLLGFPGVGIEPVAGKRDGPLRPSFLRTLLLDFRRAPRVICRQPSVSPRTREE